MFREEYRKLVSIFSRYAGVEHLNEVEDIVSETFFTALQTWEVKGIPNNPQAWLYTTAKNKILDYLRRNQLFIQLLQVP